MNHFKSKTSGGFTLIEVLIVVVIIAVLAALIIPRLVNQTERAKMAEAFHVLGALHRAEQAYMDLNGTTQYVTANTLGTESGFARLGLQAPGDTHFEYLCAWNGTANYCYAVHQPASATRWEATDSQIMFYDDKTWYCGGVLYRPGATANDPCLLR